MQEKRLLTAQESERGAHLCVDPWQLLLFRMHFGDQDYQQLSLENLGWINIIIDNYSLQIIIITTRLAIIVILKSWLGCDGLDHVLH